MRELVELCNRFPCPLREFIERTLGPGRFWRSAVIDRGMRLDNDNQPPQFFDMSSVSRPADRIAFHGYEQVGVAIGHTAGLARVDFQ